MTVEIHPGEVIHTMDHFVLDLKTPEGSSNYFTVYSVGMMRDVGPGLVVLMRISTADGFEDHCFAEEADLASRMQARLRAMHVGEEPPPGTTSLPMLADIRREPTFDSTVRWQVRTSDRSITATWSDSEPVVFVSAPAPVFHPSRDYATAMVSYRQAQLVIDGQSSAGTPYEHPLWTERLGRPFSSCHAALAETAVQSS